MNTKLYTLAGIFGALLLAHSVSSAAGVPRMPDDDEIAAQAARLGGIPEAIVDSTTADEPAQRAAETYRRLEEGQAGVPSIPELGDLSDDPKDFGSAIEEFMEGERAPARVRRTGLYVFISFSMPEASLRRVARDAEQIGATLVLRGMVENNVGKTAKRLIEVLGLKKGTKLRTNIDPPSFLRYGVEAVPAYVLVIDDTKPELACVDDRDCALTPFPHTKVAGDVTVEYALETIARGDAAARPLAEALLAKLRGELAR